MLHSTQSIQVHLIYTLAEDVKRFTKLNLMIKFVLNTSIKSFVASHVYISLMFKTNYLNLII